MDWLRTRFDTLLKPKHVAMAGDIMLTRSHVTIVGRVDDCGTLQCEANGTDVRASRWTHDDVTNFLETGGHLFRATDRRLAAAAANVAMTWATPLPWPIDQEKFDDTRLPYAGDRRLGPLPGQHRARKAANYERAVAEGVTGKTPIYLDTMRAEFQRTGRLRAIKYAARGTRPMFLGQHREESALWGRFEGAGFVCSMFVILCYQTAALAPFVDAIPARAPGEWTDPETWVSNKYHEVPKFPEDAAQAANLRALADYDRAERLDMYSPSRSRRTHQSYQTPLTRWRGGRLDTFPWEARLTGGMLVDCKHCVPSELEASLRADAHGWTRVSFSTTSG